MLHVLSAEKRSYSYRMASVAQIAASLCIRDARAETRALDVAENIRLTNVRLSMYRETRWFHARCAPGELALQRLWSRLVCSSSFLPLSLWSYLVTDIFMATFGLNNPAAGKAGVARLLAIKNRCLSLPEPKLLGGNEVSKASY